MVTIGFVIIFISQICNYIKTYGVTGLFVSCIIVGIVAILTLLVSGGSMALNKNNDLMLVIHKIATVSFLVSLVYMVLKIVKG